MKVPKLDVAGTNWVVYKDRFLWAVDARGLLEHVEGPNSEPSRPRVTMKKETGADGKEREVESPTSDDEKKLEAWREKVKVWRQGEAVVKQQIAATIPDSLFMKIRTKGTAYQIWEALILEFQNKSWMVSVDLRRRLQQQRCGDKGDMRTHLATLRTMREDLAAMGHAPTDDDFNAIIIGSLPPSYDTYISALNATSSVIGTYLSPDDLMHTITDEHDRRSLGKSSKKEENAAFHAGGGKGKKAPFSGKCFNCGKKGHKKPDCWAEGGGKAGQGPKGRGPEGDGKGKESKEGKGKESAASAKEPEAAWMAMSAFSNHDDFFEESESELPDLIQLSDSDDDSDGDPEGCPSLEELLDEREDLDGEEVLVDEGKVDEETPTEAAYTTTFDAAMLSKKNEGIDIELFDSGASRHMSGYRHRLLNYTKIETQPITAADKRTFDAIGKGDMYIDVPNGDGTSKVLIRDVLYSPSMGVTLISIGKITDSKSSVLFHGDSCRIYNNSRVLLGQIPKQNGLYRMFTPRSEFAAKVVELLSIDELHRRLGHVGYEAVRKLVEKGLVRGVELDLESKPSFCASCEWGKGHRKPIQKVREDERAAAVGDEIHSDLWGPAPVETINRKEFFISFTDDHSRYTTVYLIYKKDEAFNCYRIFEAWLGNQHKARIKKLRTDRGGEYVSNEFTDHLRKTGTV